MMTIEDAQHAEMVRLATWLGVELARVKLSRRVALDDVEEQVTRLSYLVLAIDRAVREGRPPTVWSNEATQGDCTS